MLIKCRGKKFLIAAVAATLFAACVTSAAAQQNSSILSLTDKEQVWLREHPVVRVASDRAYAPFEFVDEDNVFKGMGMEYINEIGERLGIDYAIIWKILATAFVVAMIFIYGNRKLAREVSQRKLAEKQLQDINKELEERVKERTVSLDQINKQLEQDIAERKIAEEKLKDSEEKYRSLIKTSPDLIFITDRETGRIINVNDSACDMLGYSRDEIVGTVSGDRVVSSQRDDYRQELEKLKKTGRYSGEYEVRKKDGSTISVEVGGAAFGKYLFAIGRDITKRKRAEMELQEHRSHLESLVGKRTAELAVAKERAESADRLKSAFLATMSHELRTPLNSIIGFTSIILQELSGPLNDEQKEYMEMVQNSSRHLLDLINDILDISKIEAGQLEISEESFDMRESIVKAVQTITPLAEQKGLPLMSRIGPEVGKVVSDQRRIEQILINLASNAVKFTEKGKVLIECEVNGSKLVTRVRDTGIGMKPGDIEKLFQPFQQIDNTIARQHEGTGLGLSICKKLAELMGGEIKVESQWNEGSTFTFTLPLK